MFNEKKLAVLKEYYTRLMNRVVGWKVVLANWQLGTRDRTNGTFQALQDLHESLLRKQVQLDAITEILVTRGTIRPEELLEKQIELAIRLDQSFESKFSGAKATDTGIKIVDAEDFQETKDRLGFPL